jgi:hypothetical protein
LVCYFRVATGLRKAWANQGSAALSASVGSAIAGLDGKGWIGQEDRLTWYRNRTAQDENVAGLVVVLVGLNHATDQGGLADFHRVDESRLIAQLKESFQPWLQRICSRLGLNPGETELDRFDTALQQLFELRPLRLGKLAEFLEPLIQPVSASDRNTAAKSWKCVRQPLVAWCRGWSRASDSLVWPSERPVVWVLPSSPGLAPPGDRAPRPGWFKPLVRGYVSATRRAPGIYSRPSPRPL